MAIGMEYDNLFGHDSGSNKTFGQNSGNTFGHDSGRIYSVV
jgi:hypothetical protein